MIRYQPKVIYLDPQVKESPITKNILNAFSNVPVIESVVAPNVKDEVKLFADPLLEGKKRLWITANKGKLVKKCGAATSSLDQLLCCNYFILDFSFNCHFECVYCFLQEYTNQPFMIVYANIDDMLESVQKLIDSTESNQIRIGTGEMADSLALDEITGFTKYLVPFFAKQNKAILELKTKSSAISNLLDLEHNGKTVIAWSLNPEAYVNEYEFKTASLDDRFRAATKCQKAGYPVAFHLDPLIYEPNWERDYKALIDRIYAEFNPKWISLGGLRYNANLKAIVQKRFPRTRLTTGEFISAPDGKKKYLRVIREEMYRTLNSYIHKKQSDTPTYLCMENGLVWKNSMSLIPESELSLESHIVRASSIK